MARIHFGDMFRLQRDPDGAGVLVQYVEKDSYFGEVCRIFRQGTCDIANLCDAVAGETWFYICCPIDVAVEKGLATPLGRCDIVEEAVFRKLGDDGRWYLRTANIDKALGSELPTKYRSLSPYNLATPLALLDLIEQNYDPAEDVEESTLESSSLLGRLLSRRPRSPTSGGSPLTLTVHVLTTATDREVIADRSATWGWHRRDAGDQFVLARLLQRDDLISDLLERLSNDLEPFGAAVSDHEVGPLPA